MPEADPDAYSSTWFPQMSGSQHRLAKTVNPSTYLLAHSARDHTSVETTLRGGPFLENFYCLRCNRELESGQKSVSVYVFAQTVGIRPRQKSAAQRICFCPQCSVSLAMGPPPEGALNIAAWHMMRELVTSDPALTAAAWEALHGIEGLLPANGTDGVPRRTAAGYLEF